MGAANRMQEKRVDMNSGEENKRASKKEAIAFFWLAIEALILCLMFALSVSIRTRHIAGVLPSHPPKILLFLGEAAFRFSLNNPFAVFPFYFIFIFVMPVFIKDRVKRIRILRIVIILLAIFIAIGLCLILSTGSGFSPFV